MADLVLTVVAGPRMWSRHLLSAVQDILHNSPEFWDTPYLDDASPDEMVSKIEQLIGRLRTVDAATFQEVADGMAKVTILGNTVSMPDTAAAALRLASTTVPFRAGAFLPGAHSRALAVARQFLRLGALRIAD